MVNSFVELLNNFKNMPIELDTFLSIPQDSNLNVLAPIDEINHKLELYKHLIRVGHINAVSLPKYRDQISRVIKRTKFDILAVSETYIKNTTPKNRYKIDGYKFFGENRENKNNGGVGIYVSDIFKAKRIKVNYKGIQPEIIFVEIEVNNTKIIVSTVYKSPCVRYGVYSDIIEYLAYFSTKYEHAIFTGDFNIDFLQTNSPSFKFLNNNILIPLSLTQIIKDPTRVTERSSTLIDLILVNSPSNVKAVGNTCIIGDLDHAMVYCAYSVRKPKFKPQIIRRRDFRNFQPDKFKNDIQNAPWHNIQNVILDDLDQATTHLEDIFSATINNNAPFREIKVTKPLDSSWMTDDVTHLMDLRDKYRRKWLELKQRNTNNTAINPNPLTDFFHNRFKELRNIVNHSIRDAKKTDFNNKLNKKIKDCKKFHSALKQFDVVAAKNSVNITCHSDPNLLNNTFTKHNNANVAQDRINNYINKINRTRKPCTFNFSEVSSEDIKKAALSLKSNACGIDEISAFFIKLSIDKSAGIFAEIVNASLRSGYFPSRWKKARIKPIPKINEPILASDYRPISLLIAFSKILEKIVSSQMKTYLVENNLLDKFQSAYKNKHSTITALLEITDNIYSAMDVSEITVLVLLDYSKAFDCANHKIILAKLKSFGFNDLPLNWINSYLSDRSQQVVTEKGESNWINLVNGVPQGSILGPLLFTILVSDIASNIRFCKYHLYADDTQLYISGKVEEINNLIKNINSDLNRIANFSLDNSLKLNEGKSTYIIIGSSQNIEKLNKMNLLNITINNKIIERETIVKNLGILFDENLCWDPEINKVVANGYAKLKQAYFSINFLNEKSKITLVKTYLLSQFNYNSIILQNLNNGQISKIQQFQNACTRFIFNLRKFDHISQDFNSLNILNMINTRNLQSLTLMHKIITKQAPIYLTDKVIFNHNIHNHRTRTRRHIRTRNFNTNFGRNCFHNKIGNLYNQVTNSLEITAEVSVNAFKNKVRKYLLNLQV